MALNSLFVLICR